MKLRNTKWLKPPEFPGDPHKTQQAKIMHATLLAFFILLPTIHICSWFGGNVHVPVSLFICLLLICVLAYYFLRQGFVNQVSVLLLTSTFIVLTIDVALIGTVRAPITTGYYSIIIIAGLLFDLRGIILATVLSSVAIAGLIIAQNHNLLPLPNNTVTFTQWTIYTALFIANGSLSIYVLRATRRALANAETELEGRIRTEEALKRSEEQLQKSNVELQQALAEVKTLHGMLPICAQCKKIRDDKGYWNQLETYISKHTDATFTHGICPDCAKEFIASYRKEG